MTKEKSTRPPLSSLACVNRECDEYGCKGKENLIIRKVYGQDNIRYLRCRVCQEEFSERKNTALFNSKIGEARAIGVAKQLAEGTSLKGTARVQDVAVETVRRLRKRLGRHGEQFHDERVVDVKVEELQADERHGFAGERDNQVWEAEMIAPESKFVLSHVQGKRDEALVAALYADTVKRVDDPQRIALFTDGFARYKTLFPRYFGRPYRPLTQGGGDHTSCAFAFRVKPLTFKSSSTGKGVSSNRLRFATRMGHDVALTTLSTNLAMTCQTPLLSSSAMQPPV